MAKLLLISNSVSPAGYLAHCADAIQAIVGDRTVLFLPYAAHRDDWDAYVAKVQNTLGKLGIKVTTPPQGAVSAFAREIEEAEAIFIGGGNTFRLLNGLSRQWWSIIGKRIKYGGIPYIGSSAGANVACPAIATTNDMPIAWPESLNAMELIPFQINPHFTDQGIPGHHGETRSARLREYVQATGEDVLGICEGGWLTVDDKICRLHGAQAHLFEPNEENTTVFEPGSDLSFLLG